MCASWNDKYKPDLIAERLENIKSIDNNTGKASFSSIEHYDLMAVLCSVANLSGNIPEIDKHRIILKGTFSAANAGKITAKRLLKEISILEKIFINQKEEHYVLATSLSIRRNINIKYDIDSVIITITPSLPPIYKKNRDNLHLQPHVKYMIEKVPLDYSSARVIVKARSTDEGGETALRNLDLIRGIWNLSLNRLTTLSISFGGKRKPINKILLGPFHTLHERNGNLKTDNFWYEPDFKLLDPYSFDKKEEIENLISFTKIVRNKINKCLYKEIIKEGIIRYTRALDYTDYEIAFLKLWSTLELLTNTVKESYDKTIKRVAFLFSDYDFHSQILNHLRDFRNKTIHADSSGNPDTQTYLYQLKNYVERLIIYHLTNRMKFQKLSEAANFLDLSPNIELLKEKLELYKRGINFLS